MRKSGFLITRLICKRQKPDTAHLDRGDGTFHQDAGSVTSSNEPWATMGDKSVFSSSTSLSNQLSSSRNYIYKTSTSYFTFTILHDGWGYFQKRPEVGHVAFQLHLRFFCSKNSTTGKLKQFRLIRHTHERLRAVCGTPVTIPVTTACPFQGLIDRLFHYHNSSLIIWYLQRR